MNNNKLLKIIVIIIIITIISIPIIIKFKNNNYKENFTIKLRTDSDFIEWFNTFDKLYKKKISNPTYTLTTESFELINNIIYNKETNNSTYYKEGIYHIKENTTLELDVNTRSFRYTLYDKDNIKEILEVRLLNGSYYIKLLKNKKEYKIILNKDKKKIKKSKNTKESLDKTIYKVKEFEW